jgi:hypothetical protein
MRLLSFGTSEGNPRWGVQVGDGAQVEAQARHEAKKNGWTFDRMAGDLVLIRRLLVGDWERDLLVLQHGQQIDMTYNDDVVGCLDGDHESDRDAAWEIGIM